MTNSFIKLILAYLKGDEAEAKAIRIQKRGSAVLGIEISSLRSKILQVEDQVEQCKEELTRATINNGDISFSEDTYITRMISAKNNLVQHENKLKDLREKLEFFEERKAFVEGKEAKVEAKK